MERSFLNIIWDYRGSNEAQRLEHELNSSMREDYYQLYAELRMKYCSFMDSLSVVFLAPCCEDCFNEELFEEPRLPDVLPSSWENDLAWLCSPEFFWKIYKRIEDDQNFHFSCLRCKRELRPWNGDFFYIITRLLESYFNIPEEVSNVNPNRKTKQAVTRCYGYCCFNCGATEDLHIDHIMPRRDLGTGEYSNLQPLCSECGSQKGSETPEEYVLYIFAEFLIPDDCHYEQFYQHLKSNSSL